MGKITIKALRSGSSRADIEKKIFGRTMNKDEALLLIYPFVITYDKTGEALDTIDQHMIGLSLAFPESDTADRIAYEINTVN